MNNSYISPGPLKDWEPDKINSNVIGDSKPAIIEMQDGGQNFLKESLPPISSAEVAILNEVDRDFSSLFTKSIPHDIEKFSITNPTFVTDIKSMLLGYIQIYYSSIKLVSSMWSKLPILLGYRSLMVNNLNLLTKLYTSFSNRNKDNTKVDKAIPIVSLELLNLRAEIILAEVPRAVFNTLPFEVYEFMTNLYKTLVLCVEEISKDRYKFQPSDTFADNVETTKYLLALYNKINTDLIYSVDRDKTTIKSIENLLIQLESIKEKS